MVFDNKIWVLGGRDKSRTSLNDVWWSSDGRNWANANANNHWAGRDFLTAVVFDNKMWIMGGDGGPKNDVWWSSNGTSWTKVNSSGHWSTRNRHAAVTLDEQMFLIGGNGDSGQKGDVWVYQQTN